MKKLNLLKLRATLLLLLSVVAMNVWGETVTYTLTIGANDFNATSYAANNNEKTTNAVCTTDETKTMGVKWTSYQVMKNSSAMQWQKNTGYIYNSTDLGTIKNISFTSQSGSFTKYYGTEAQPSSNTTVGNGFFKIINGSSTGSTQKVIVTFEIEEGAPAAVAAPSFSLPEGTYYGAQSVELACATEGASIYYTTDGTEPTASSTAYTAAIPGKKYIK